jgi:hypothetical protein
MGEVIDLLPSAREALIELADNGVPMAIVSSTGKVAWARHLVEAIRLDERRSIADVLAVPIEIGPEITWTLKDVERKAGEPFADANAIFFGALTTEVTAAKALGLKCYPCPWGLTTDVYEDALEDFASGWRRRLAGSRRRLAGRLEIHSSAESEMCAWLSAWHERIEDWWLAAALPDAHNCLGALGLHLAHRFDALLRTAGLRRGRLPPPPSDVEGCEWLSNPAHEVPASPFALPPPPHSSTLPLPRHMHMSIEFLHR